MKTVKLLLSLVFITMLFAACNTHVVNTENLNVRATPSTNGTVIGQLHYNDRIKVTPHNDTWGQIEYKNETGYVAMKHLITKKEKFETNVLGIVIIVVMTLMVGGRGFTTIKRKKDGSIDRRYKR